MINRIEHFETLDYINAKGVRYQTRENILYRDNVKVLALDHAHGIFRYDLDNDFVVVYIAQALRTLLGYTVYKVTMSE